MGQIFHTDDIGTGFFGSFCSSALGENCNTNGLACTGRHNDGTADSLIALTRIDAELNCDINGFVELGIGKSFDEFDSFIQSVELLSLNLALVFFFAFADLRHYFTPSTVIPMERALPAIVRTAASMSAAVRSGILVLAISSA